MAVVLSSWSIRVYRQQLLLINPNKCFPTYRDGALFPVYSSYISIHLNINDFVKLIVVFIFIILVSTYCAISICTNELISI